MYASRCSPKPLLEEIINYKPKSPTSTAPDPWAPIFDRVLNHKDDGHAAKLVRAIAHAQDICKPYENSDRFRIKGDMWLQLGHMGIDTSFKTLVVPL